MKFGKACRRTLSLGLLAASFASIGTTGIALAESADHTITHAKWAGNTREAINGIIANNAGKKTSYAVFDWDNTCIYPDTEENLLIYQLQTLSFKMTPDEFRYSFMHFTDTSTNKNLSIPADNFATPYKNTEGKPISIAAIADDCCSDYTFLYNNYRALNPAASGNMTLEEIKATDQYKDFKAKVWFTYSALYDSFAINVSYTWITYIMFPGFTSEEIRELVVKASNWALARENRKVYFDSPKTLPGKAGAISNTDAGNYFRNAMRLTPEIGQLFEALEKNGIPVHISTASLQDIIDEVATNPTFGYNLPKNRVLGMRLIKDQNGRFTAHYDRSGGYTINSVDGKAQNINSVLAKKYLANPVMIAGDSDGDYAMMTQLSGLNNVTMINSYKPLQLVLIINRVKGGKIGELCRIAADQLTDKKTVSTAVVIQGRDENTGEWIPTEKCLKLGKTGDENRKLLP